MIFTLSRKFKRTWPGHEAEDVAALHRLRKRRFEDLFRFSRSVRLSWVAEAGPGDPEHRLHLSGQMSPNVAQTAMNGTHL